MDPFSISEQYLILIIDDYSEIYFQLLHIYTMKILNLYLLHSKISIEIG